MLSTLHHSKCERLSSRAVFSTGSSDFKNIKKDSGSRAKRMHGMTGPYRSTAFNNKYGALSALYQLLSSKKSAPKEELVECYKKAITACTDRLEKRSLFASFTKKSENLDALLANMPPSLKQDILIDKKTTNAIPKRYKKYTVTSP